MLFNRTSVIIKTSHGPEGGRKMKKDNPTEKVRKRVYLKISELFLSRHACLDSLEYYFKGVEKEVNLPKILESVEMFNDIATNKPEIELSRLESVLVKIADQQKLNGREAAHWHGKGRSLGPTLKPGTYILQLFLQPGGTRKEIFTLLDK